MKNLVKRPELRAKEGGIQITDSETRMKVPEMGDAYMKVYSRVLQAAPASCPEFLLDEKNCVNV